jgi:PIN domain nuclease of toxin-antitoxin system
MRLLLDTQLVVWAGLAPERIHDSTRHLLEEADLLVSAATVWELAIKQGRGKLDLGSPVGGYVRRACAELGAVRTDVTVEQAAAVEELPLIHRDPFDRLLVVQAHDLGATLLTADRTLAAYGSVVQVVQAGASRQPPPG